MVRTCFQHHTSVKAYNVVKAGAAHWSINSWTYVVGDDTDDRLCEGVICIRYLERNMSESISKVRLENDALGPVDMLRSMRQWSTSLNHTRISYDA